MNTPKPSNSRELEQPKTLEEILQDVLEGFQVYAENQYTDPRAAKYGKNFVEAKQQALTQIQALIEREVINIDEEVFEQSPWKKDQEISMKNKVRNELRATQRQNLSKLIRGEE